MADLPGEMTLDCEEVRLPVHPMLALRIRVFIDWHAEVGRIVGVIPPVDTEARELFDRLGLTGAGGEGGSVVLPVTRLTDSTAVETVAERVRELLEYEMTDIAELGAACYMAVSELCGNAVEHGRSVGGFQYVAAARFTEPRRRVSIAIGDLGIGIPGHLRQQEPELADDDFAIARAMEPRVSGTGHPHRGNGFTETFEAALTSTLHAARIQVYSGNGVVQREIVQENPRIELFPAANRRQGTWITYDLVSASG